LVLNALDNQAAKLLETEIVKTNGSKMCGWKNIARFILNPTSLYLYFIIILFCSIGTSQGEIFAVYELVFSKALEIRLEGKILE
jgi:hypothetical protein